MTSYSTTTMKMLRILALTLLASSSYAHEPKVVAPGDVTETPFPGHGTFLLSDQSGTPSGTAVLRIVLPPNTFGAPPHVHSKEDEHFYVISGTVEFLDRASTHSAGPGSLVVLPRGYLHGFWNLSDEPAEMLLVVTPGEFASFFDSVVARVRSEHPANPERVGAIIAEVAAQYSVEIFPDKIPASAHKVMPN
jgi:quercetin dioxygenase-like cupin family protein